MRLSLRSLLVVSLISGALAVMGPATSAPNDFVTMSDGVEIAVNVRLPDNFVAGQDYPTIFEMSGYDGGSAQGQTLSGDIADKFDGALPGGYGNQYMPLQEDSRQLTFYYYAEYVTVHASVRGTGCSGGEFDLFNSRTALDGVEVIRWIKSREWSNGIVGILGHSYGGLTGFLTAAMDGYLAEKNGTAPEVTAMTVSGLIDDLYRGIVYPGGVSNYGFPLLWTGGIRPAYDVGGGTLPGLLRPLDDPSAEQPRKEDCARNVSTHSRTVLDDPIVNGTSDVDGDWYKTRSLIYYVDRITVPIHITGAYQDEQTGARGPANLWEHIHNASAKRLVLTNGNHGTNQTDRMMIEERKAWMDHYLRGIGSPYPATSVRVLFESRNSGGHVWSAEKSGASYPFEDTQWTNLYLHSSGLLNNSLPGAEDPDSYFSGSMRQSWFYETGPGFGPPFTTEEGPDELNYQTAPFEGATALAGPLAATLYLSTTATDTELFVQVMDIGPDGSTSYLQRGLLKATHNKIDPSLSDLASNGEIYRPFRPHTNPTSITPGAINEYLVEIWPVGHIFRPGHRLALKITAPPAIDSYYIYVPKRPVGWNTLYHDAGHPSRLMAPLVPADLSNIGAELPCGGQTAVRCIS